MAHTDLNGRRLDSRRRAHPKGALVFQHACKLSAEGDCVEAPGLALQIGAHARLAQVQEP